MSVLPSRNLPMVAQIEQDLRNGSRSMIATAIDKLAAHGIKPGARVCRVRNGRYEEFSLSRVVSSLDHFDRSGAGVYLYCYGFKLRRDGTYGTHEHPLGRPEDLIL